MESKWSENEAQAYIDRYGDRWGQPLALRTYTSRLLGTEPELVLHGGGNTSVKATHRDLFGETVPALFVKASGRDLATVEPFGHCALDLAYLRRLRELPELSDEAMFNALLTHRFDAGAPSPSLEALMHAFIDETYIDHTHADAVLVLSNRRDGAHRVADALGPDVIVLDYVLPGFELAKAAALAYDESPRAVGMVLLKHGLVTWGETARQAYQRTIELVSRAERYLERKLVAPSPGVEVTAPDDAVHRYLEVAPMLRGLLATRSDDPDRPFRRFVLRPLIDEETLALVDSERGKALALTPPLTSDHLIRTKPLPLWVDAPRYDDAEALRAQLREAISTFARDYDAYVDRHAGPTGGLPAGLRRFDPMPRVVLLPGLGAVCAGPSVEDADIVRDITRQTLSVKWRLPATGTYEGLSEAHLFEMEYRPAQHAKLGGAGEPPLARTTALVTGAAGAIGAGICEALLDAGCHVAVTDLAGEHLGSLVERLQARYGERVIGVPLDVTEPDSVQAGFEQVSLTWGGVDLVVPNAGVAHVASLATMDPDDFQRVHAINTEGTFLVLAEAARHFATQATGGDVVLVSTKNVFSPGANFGAYSATKAAAHQLARIASLELAPLGVRVNMVSPDAVFSHGDRRSGLWAEVGPDRMRARNLDEQGLEDYYQNRNLLKARVTARHVANAVLYFATRQSPTTGATIPVDGGLPDSTPR